MTDIEFGGAGSQRHRDADETEDDAEPGKPREPLAEEDEARAQPRGSVSGKR